MRYVRRVLILGHLDRQSGRSIVQGVTRYAHVYGPWVLYHRIPFYKTLDDAGEMLLSEDDYLCAVRTMLESGKMDGLIAEMPSCGMAAKMLPHEFPAVVIPIRDVVPGFVNLISQQPRTGIMAAEYLLNLGFKNFAFFGLSSLYWSQCREHAFRERLASEGIRPFIYNQKSSGGRLRWHEELQDIGDLLTKLPRPLAVWAWNDDLAETVIEACRMLNILVPDEVCVLGADNDELFCNLCDPPLSSVAMNFERAGFEMAETLDRLMKGDRPPFNALELHASCIVERQSTEIVAIEDREVSLAIRFIRQNAYHPIQVDDVVRRLAISRSALYERFRRVTGRTIYDEIRRVRVETIARALVTTSTAIKEISYKLGFSSEDHLSRYFRAVKRITPQAYRKKFGIA